jgi:hypothetical protein
MCQRVMGPHDFRRAPFSWALTTEGFAALEYQGLAERSILSLGTVATAYNSLGYFTAQRTSPVLLTPASRNPRQRRSASIAEIGEGRLHASYDRGAAARVGAVLLDVGRARSRARGSS